MSLAKPSSKPTPSSQTSPVASSRPDSVSVITVGCSWISLSMKVS